MPVLCKRSSSFKPDIIMFLYKLIILNLIILDYKLKQLSHRLQPSHINMQVKKS